MSEYKYIDQDALVSALEDICGGSGAGLTVKEEMLDIVRSFPTADVQEVKHGYWSQSKKTAFSEECSVCGCTVEHDDGLVIRYPRCPFCGAKMDEKENEG